MVKSVSKPHSYKSVSDSELNNLKTRWLKRRTFNKMQWGVRTFKEWRNDKLNDEHSFDPIILAVNLDDLQLLMKENLSYALCRFIPEITKKKDGKDYPGKTLYKMLMSIQKYLNQNNVTWHLLDDPSFLDVKTVLDNVMKERARENIGMVKKQAEFISIDYENELWRSGVLGEDTPDKLRDTVLFLLGINLALRAGDEHDDLRRDSPGKPSQLQFERDEVSGKRCLVYREDTVTKMNDGGLANLKKEHKVVWIFPSQNINRCPVCLVDKYVSLCPEVTEKTKKANVYLRSLEKTNPAQWYGVQAVSKNTLAKVVSNLLKSCNLDGYFTNHSLRRRSATHLFQAGIDKKIVKEITGYVSDALDRYQVTSREQKETVSNILRNEQSVKSEVKLKTKEPSPPTPSLELCVRDASQSPKGPYHCCWSLRENVEKQK